ncbi:MAG: PAS domain-containing protein [Actinomycetota bacterium]
MAQIEPLSPPSPQRRDAILEAVAFAARRLVEAPDWHEAADEVLERLGQAACVSRTYIFRNHRGEDGILRSTQMFEWCAPGITSFLGDAELEAEPWDEAGFGRWRRMLEGGEPVVSLTRDLEPNERPQLERQGILAIVDMPVFEGHSWWGTIGFDDCVAERHWPQAEVDALRTAAGVLGAVIERQRADLRVHETDLRYRSLIEHTPLVTYEEVVPEGSASTATFIYVSPQIEDLLGYTPDRWREEGFWTDILHPDDRASVAELSEDVITTGGPYRQDYRFVAADGRHIWVRDESRLVTAPGVWPQLWQGALLDITDRKLAEQELEQTRARLQAIVDNVPVVIYAEPVTEELDLFLSPQVEPILGWTAEEWLADDDFWVDHIHPDDLPDVERADLAAEDSLSEFVSEYRFRHKDGRWIWISDHAVMVRDDEGHPSYWQGCFIDITKRKRMERALRQAETRFRTLIEHMPAVTYVEGLVAREVDFYISPQVEIIFGYTPEEWKTTKNFWFDRVHPDDLERVAAEDTRTNETAAPVNMEYRFRAADGTWRWVHDEAVLVTDDEGGPSFWQGFLLDITQRKESEDQLAHALEVERDAAQRLREMDEMKDTFLQAVSHDLRTPLAAILGLAVTLGREDLELDASEGRELATRIAQNARKLQRLVTDLLDLDRLSRGIVEPARQPVELGGLLRRLVDETDLLRDHPVQVNVDPEPLIAALDAAKVERIVENLLANSARHTARGTQVWITARHVEEGVLLSVEDAGDGVPYDERASIFEPFRQGSEAPTHSPGVGVGLTLVARFAELHGGRAWVEDRDGGGAAFRVLLPDGDLGTRWREEVG